MTEQRNNLHVEEIQGKKASFDLDNVWLYSFVLAWGFAAFYIYLMQVIVPGYRDAFELSGEILRRSAVAPYAYRVIVPLLIKVLSMPLTGLLTPQKAFLASYCVYCFAAIEFSTLMLFRMLRLWFDAMSSLLGIMMFCFMVAVAAHYQYFAPWSYIEPGLCAAAIILGVGGSRRGRWALLLTVAAALNRETGLFVPLLFCAALPGHWLDRKRMLWLAVLVGTWFVIFCGLRVAIGSRPNPFHIATTSHNNLLPISIALTLIASAAFFSVSAPSILGWGHAPQEIRRCTVVLLLYVPLVLVFAYWWEVRVWLPLACVLLPLAIGGVQAIVSGPGRTRSVEVVGSSCDRNV